MSTRRNCDVTLPHSDALRVMDLLSDYASQEGNHARKTRSAAIREHCERVSLDARRLAEYIGSRVWRWEESKQ